MCFTSLPAGFFFFLSSLHVRYRQKKARVRSMRLNGEDRRGLGGVVRHIPFLGKSTNNVQKFAVQSTCAHRRLF